ncbi:MAG: hypothetical protein JRJ12_00475 [Deltaproteobacteria bacterium]|nr:hypothetical protein [Deltaproteobacteria bacterium]MBW2069840.1 hypothetical protein [Deltaproteobacteria bacterium]
MRADRLKDLMPKRPRYHQMLPLDLEDQVASLYEKLEQVPFIRKRGLEYLLERFCYAPEPARELKIWH